MGSLVNRLRQNRAQAKPQDKAVKEPWRINFWTKPLNVIDYCRTMAGKMLYPEQAKTARAIWGDDPTVWRGPCPADVNEKRAGQYLNEVLNCWGKGGGVGCPGKGGGGRGWWGGRGAWANCCGGCAGHPAGAPPAPA